MAAPVDVSVWTRKSVLPAASLPYASSAAATSSGVGPDPSFERIMTGFAPAALIILGIIPEKTPLTQTNPVPPRPTRLTTDISTATCPGTGMRRTSFFVPKTFSSLDVVSS